jgi:Tfp pilus assembly protein PilN
MGQFDLNLSTRPFKPYRARNLGLFALLMILVAVSAYQVYSYQRFSALAAANRQEENLKRQEADKLKEQLRAINAKMKSGNAGEKLSEVEQFNQLLIRKSFSWTRVLATLERLIPEDVRVLSLQPLVDEQGKTFLNMNVRGRTLDDATRLLKALETSKAFGDVALAVEEKKENEVEFTLSAYYVPDGGSSHTIAESVGRGKK